MSTVTIAAQNMSHNGLYTPNGDPDPGRWDGLMDTISHHRPDVLLLQEVGRWTENNRTPIARAEQALGMRMVGIVTTPAGGGTALMLNPDTVGWEQWEDRYASRLHHGFGVAVLRLPGLDTPLAAISAHLTPYSATAAAQEAQILVARAYRYGGIGIIGGDINHFPLDDHAIPDPHTIPPTTGPRDGSAMRAAPTGQTEPWPRSWPRAGSPTWLPWWPSAPAMRPCWRRPGGGAAGSTSSGPPHPWCPPSPTTVATAMRSPTTA